VECFVDGEWVQVWFGTGSPAADLSLKSEAITGRLTVSPFRLDRQPRTCRLGGDPCTAHRPACPYESYPRLLNSKRRVWSTSTALPGSTTSGVSLPPRRCGSRCSIRRGHHPTAVLDTS